MEKRLRWRFVGYAIASIGIVAFLVGVIIMVSINGLFTNSLDAAAVYIADNDGDLFAQGAIDANIFEVGFNDITKRELRYFYVEVENGNYSHMQTTYYDDVDEEEIQECIDGIANNIHDSGNYSYYRYYRRQVGNKTQLVFINRGLMLSVLEKTRNLVILSLLVICVLLFVILYLLSGRAVEPYIKNSRAQKVFISDAGHEIKTPLAVINANIEVLEMKNGENKWTNNIKGQVIRLDGLIKGLITLSKIEDVTDLKEDKSKINLSEQIRKQCEEFSVLAESNNKTIVPQIADQVFVEGVPMKIAQLSSSLIENALKYATDGGEILVEVKKNRKAAIISISNPCAGLDKNNINNLFERFYRADKSRNDKVRGYGIGLSVVKAIAESHKGSVHAKLEENEDGQRITFTVTL